MLYVVCYDVSDDGTRAQLSQALLGFGTRIQESVFECVLTAAHHERMLAEIGRIALADTDRVRVYRLCARCLDVVQIYGPGEITRDRPFYVV